MNNENKRGPKFESWGTPDVRKNLLDKNQIINKSRQFYGNKIFWQAIVNWNSIISDG